MNLIFDTHENEKQKEAARAWVSPDITDVGYGGAKAGGKSWLAVNLIFGDALIYPDTRYFIGRKTLNDLRKYTSGTVDKVFKGWGLQHKKHWSYNGQDNFYQLYNESRVYFIELAFQPSDEDFARFGSREFTRGWIEEEGEVMEAARRNICVTVGRYNNHLYNLTGKTGHTFNPAKNHLYRTYYKPWKENALPSHRVFINTVPQDNKMLPPGYIETLERELTNGQKQRLLYGNWDYDDDPRALCSWDAITDCFTNEILPTGKKRISADLAMKGRDRFVGGLWDGLIVDVRIDMPKADGKTIETKIKGLMQKENVGHSQTIVDADGMGGYLESYLNGIVEFHGGGRAVDDVQFSKIKDELGYKLAEVVEKRLIKIICTPEQRDKIEQQLSALKADDIDVDTKKKKIVAKDEMKEQLGESPDYLDMLLMGMWFEINGFLLTANSLKTYNPQYLQVAQLATERLAIVMPPRGNDGRFSAIVGYLIKDKVYIHDVICNDLPDSEHTAAFIVSNKIDAAKLKCTDVWHPFGRDIRSKIQQKKSNCNFRITDKSSDSKSLIFSQATFIANNFIFRSDWQEIPEYSRFVKEITGYSKSGENKQDECMDSAAELAKYFQEMHKNLW